MSKLTTKQRKAMPASDYALSAQKAYPVKGTGSVANDRKHAANAKSRATQQYNAGNLTAGQKATVDRKANAVLNKGKKK
jgi:hypothetical protein